MVIFNNDVSTVQVAIPLGYGVIDAIGLLFSCTPLPLGFCEGGDRNAMENSIPSCSCESCALHISS